MNRSKSVAIFFISVFAAGLIAYLVGSLVGEQTIALKDVILGLFGGLTAYLTTKLLYRLWDKEK